MLAFVQVAAPALLIAVAVLWVFVLIAVYAWVIRPIVEWLTKPGGGFFKRAVFWPVRKAASAVDRLMREHIAALRRWATANLRPLVLVLDQLAEIENRTSGTIGDMAEQTYNALRVLRQDTVPRLIRNAVTPLQTQLQRHTGRLDALEDLNRRVSGALGDTLRALPWGAPGGYVSNFETFLGRFVQLWRHYWNTTRAELDTLLRQTIPEIRRDVADLARRLDVQIDARFDAIAARVTALETRVEQIVIPRLAALELAVETLVDATIAPIGEAVLALTTRIVELERVLDELATVTLAALEARVTAIETELRQAVDAGLERFGEHILELERQITVVIPQRLAAIELELETLVAEALGDIGDGLRVLTDRIVALEAYVFGELREQIELVTGQIVDLNTRIDDVILPRLRAIEELLAPAAFAALVLATMRQVAPNLFCRNTTSVTQRICGMDENLLAQLLAGSLVFALVVDPRALLVLGQQIEGAIDGVVREIADA